MALLGPPNQKYRAIGFYLEGGPRPPVRLDLQIRPEELTLSEPSRLAVQQTLGGAWVDSFDIGIREITLAGTLGWRGGVILSGEDAFAALRTTVFLDWHKRREEAIQQATDPNEVSLTFIDTLDGLTFVVAPQSFTLRRSKSSPLLMRYQIRLLVVDDADAPSGILDKIMSALSNPLRFLAGVTGLTGVLGTLDGYINQGLALYGAASGAVRQFMGVAAQVMQAVNVVAGPLRGLFVGADAGLLTAARSIVSAGSNGLAALSPDPTLPADLLIPALRLPALLNDAACTMANSFSLGRNFASYDDLFGASTCSSTGGGGPASPFALLGSNPFETYFPNETARIAVSAAADASIKALSGDALLLRGQDAVIAGHLATIAGGVTLR